MHVIDLAQFENLVEKVNTSISAARITTPEKKATINFYLEKISERLGLLKGKASRSARSIDWIGSAWKWIAGNPDAMDWNKVLSNEQEIISNNNQQYKINDRLFSTMRETTEKINRMIDLFKNEIQTSNAVKNEQNILNEILIVKDEIGEIIRACQMAKSGLINTNLLDKEEINRIIGGIETLPYANEIEAVEYGSPSVYTNGSLLLYVLSMPKVKNEEFNLLLTRPSIVNGLQVDMEFDRMLINHKETFGIIGKCLSINNMVICDEKSLEKIEEDSCVARLLKGGHTTCTFRTNTREVIELVKEDTVFVTNFDGPLISADASRSLNGTYVIQLNNEMIQLRNKTFSSFTYSSVQVLPPVLANITNRVQKIDLEHVHSMSIKNIERLKDLTEQVKISSFMDVSIVALVLVIAWTLWRKASLDFKFPSVNLPGSGTDPVSHEGQHRVHESPITRAWSSASDVTLDLRGVDL